MDRNFFTEGTTCNTLKSIYILWHCHIPEERYPSATPPIWSLAALKLNSVLNDSSNSSSKCFWVSNYNCFQRLATIDSRDYKHTEKNMMGIRLCSAFLALLHSFRGHSLSKQRMLAFLQTIYANLSTVHFVLPVCR